MLCCYTDIACTIVLLSGEALNWLSAASYTVDIMSIVHVYASFELKSVFIFSIGNSKALTEGGVGVHVSLIPW